MFPGRNFENFFNFSVFDSFLSLSHSPEHTWAIFLKELLIFFNLYTSPFQKFNFSEGILNLFDKNKKIKKIVFPTVGIFVFNCIRCDYIQKFKASITLQCQKLKQRYKKNAQSVEKSLQAVMIVHIVLLNALMVLTLCRIFGRFSK